MSKYIDLKILAVTKMLQQVCVAGVDESNNWMRPVRLPSLYLLKKDIFQETKCILKNNNVVRFLSKKRLNNSPHSEDFEVDWSFTPTIINKLDKNSQKDLFEKINETDKIGNDIRTFLVNNNRSLVLIRPDEIISCSWMDGFVSGKYRPRIYFKFNSEHYNFPCSGLVWRKYGKDIAHREPSVNMLNSNDTYFAIGMTRLFKTSHSETYWPMVIGVHPMSDVEIDYSNL